MPEEKDITRLKGGYQPENGKFGYQPSEVEKRGYQPQGSSKPEGQNPPDGGSNVSNAPQTDNSSGKKE